MESQFDLVGKFHKKFDLPVSGSTPMRIVDDEAFEFRLGFLREEMDEFEEGHRTGDLEKVADSLVDLVYVALGTAHFYGIPFDEVFTEVQRANMTKERSNGSEDCRSKRGSSLDVVKPEGWVPPDVARVLREFESSGSTLSKWDRRFMALAVRVASWSKDPDTKVGSVIVGRDPGKISLGYNGFPRGIDDSEDRLRDRDTKRMLTQHAERNAMDNADFDVQGATLYSTFFICIECAKSAITKGISRIICPTVVDREPWASQAQMVREILVESSISLREI